MNEQEKEKFIKDQISSYEEEIAKIEQAISILKEKYKENLTDLEKKIEIVKYQKDAFISYNAEISN